MLTVQHCRFPKCAKEQMFKLPPLPVSGELGGILRQKFLFYCNVVVRRIFGSLAGVRQNECGIGSGTYRASSGMRS
jgi:hypothetical protein